MHGHGWYIACVGHAVVMERRPVVAISQPVVPHAMQDRLYRSLRLCAITFATLYSSLSAASAAELVTVRLASGRTFTGEVDSATDSNQLTLRFIDGNTMIVRPIDWRAVRQVVYDGQALPAENLKRDVAALASDRPARFSFHEANQTDGQATEDEEETEPLQTTRGGTSDSATAIEIDANVANWDADVEADGLMLYVYPTNAARQLVPVSGTLEANLVGRFGGRYSYGRQFSRVGRWTERVANHAQAADGIVIRLPFQAIDPEFTHELASKGLLHVRLSVPGQGVFNASTTLRVRPYGSVRDRLQQVEGRRFFDIEH